MENRTINVAVVAEIADALGDLKDEMVFIGGAVVSLYTDDPAADEIRPTEDVDLTLNVLSLSHWNELNEKLAKLGFYPDPEGQAICSYKYKDIPVDIMSSEDSAFGPTNKWYKIGFKNLWKVIVKNQEINILSAPCYLATKLEAFNDRGKDYRTSHDIEDVIYVLDNRIDIVNEISMSEESIKKFIISELQKLIRLGLLEETLMAHIHPLMLEERMPVVMGKINQIINKQDEIVF